MPCLPPLSWSRVEVGVGSLGVGGRVREGWTPTAPGRSGHRDPSRVRPSRRRGRRGGEGDGSARNPRVRFERRGGDDDGDGGGGGARRSRRRSGERRRGPAQGGRETRGREEESDGRSESEECR